MKIMSTIISLLTALSLNVFSQETGRSILLDAIELRKLDPSKDSTSQKIIFPSKYSKEAVKLLKNYSKGSTNNEISHELKDNPFVTFEYAAHQSGAKFSNSHSPLAFPFLDVTNFAYGLTDFLIERTKTELNIAFFREFKEQFTKAEYKDLPILFPQTYQMLLVIGDQIYYYNNYIQGLRNAFEIDLNRLPYQISDWFEEHKSSIDHSIYSVVKVSLNLTLSIIESKHPGAILNEFSEELSWIDVDKIEYSTFMKIVQLNALFSESFRDTSSRNNYWVSGEQIRKLSSDEVLLKIYLGLLFQYIKLDESARNVYFGENISVLTVFDSIAVKWNRNGNIIQNLITKISNQIILVEKSVERFYITEKKVKADTTLSTRQRNAQMFNVYFDMTTSMLDVMQNTASGLRDFGKQAELNAVIDSTLQAVFSESMIVTIDTFFISKIKAVHKIGVSIFNKQYAGAVSQAYLLMSGIKLNGQQQTTSQWQTFLKYSTFMANLVEAESPEAVTAAIEAVAAPPGSYSIKRHSSFSVALNGYFGVFIGKEWYSSEDWEKWNPNNLSLSLPIGLSLNWLQTGGCLGWLIPSGILFSIIDLGIIASYRLDNTDISSTPKVQLKHIISPGVTVEWGIGQTPLTIGFGWQMGPQIREQEIKDENGNVSGKELAAGNLYHRVGLSLKVDIPIFYFAY